MDRGARSRSRSPPRRRSPSRERDRDARPRSRSRSRDARRRDRSRSGSRDRAPARERSPPRRRFAVRRGPTGWDVKPAGGEAEMSDAHKQRLRNGRRLYVGNLGDATEREVERFFGDLVYRVCVSPPKSAPILSVYISAERKFAFVEFCSIELANAMVTLDGLVWNGTPLKIRRPVDYNPAELPSELLSKVEPIRTDGLEIAASSRGRSDGAPDAGFGAAAGFGGGGSSSSAASGSARVGSKDSANRIFFGGLPRELTEANLIELLSPFGLVAVANIVRGPDGQSKGYGFAEMSDGSLTDTVVSTLHGLQMGPGRAITVSRAKGGAAGGGGGSGSAGGSGSFGLQQPGVGGSSSNTIPLGSRPGAGASSGLSQTPSFLSHPSYPSSAPASAPAPPPAPALSAAHVPVGLPSRVVALDNMVSPDELADDADYADLVADIAGECGKYGALSSVQVPRPPAPGTGRVFLAYADIAAAITAATSLAGRTFGGKPIVASYYDEGAFRAGSFGG